MARPTLDCSSRAIRSASDPKAVGDPTMHRLVDIITALLCDPRAPCLPEWTYRTWCGALAYPELRTRARASTKELARKRDEALSHPAVSLLVEWAGSRKRDDPCVGAAAALATVRLPEVRFRAGALDVCELTRRVAVAVDSAQPIRSSSPRRARLQLLADPDRLPAVEPAPPAGENPRLPAAVGELLRLAGADEDSSFASVVEAAVVQAGEWWTRHAVPVPASIDGPRLPGVVPAQQLSPPERISAHVSDRSLLGLVAGPHPGRARPCQVAWRRGLTFWVAVRLSALDTGQRPPAGTICWWRTELAVLTLGSAGTPCPPSPVLPPSRRVERALPRLSRQE
jgi:hypothetical protein